MIDTARPFIVIYVVWHPSFAIGHAVAKAIFEHFRRESYEKITGGTGISVMYRYALADGADEPLPIDFAAAETSAIVVLADQNFAHDPAWMDFLQRISDQTSAAGLSTVLFPVSMDPGIVNQIKKAEQALLWSDWNGSTEDKVFRLIGLLTFQFCRMLRHYLEHLRRPDETGQALLRFLKKVDIFLSHSKHDKNDAGAQVAKAIRKKLTERDGLGSFFDVYDIPPGLKFHDVLLAQIEISAVIAVHTDSFSSREWCRREIIEAKRHNRPLVIANCIADRDERGFPYLGNVPIVRMESKKANRIEAVISALLDEVLKDFLWQCRVELMRPKAKKGVTFLPRPPELISLASLVPATEGEDSVIVYPDPPIGAEEERLFHKIAPNLQLRSATEWLAGAIR